MKVIPKLNLNKHPSVCDNGSLIDATNLMISTDNAVLQSEPYIIEDHINSSLSHLFNKQKYSIIGVIPCNKEIVFFVKVNNEDTKITNIVRYNEDTKLCVKVTKTITEYGSNIIGTFTYNYNDLIIAFSEYTEVDRQKKNPLKVINLGNINNPIKKDDVNYNQLVNSKLHSICPEVQIPYITTDYIYGNAYKGWYYIFVRYKISDNTYTQWFNTNNNVYIDNFNNSNFFKYFVSTEQTGNASGLYNAANSSSNGKDISNLSFKCSVNNIDNNYDIYQLGFICISKGYTKCYRSNDILVNKTSTFAIKTSDDFIFSSNSVVTYNVNDIIKTFVNYFNIKTLTNCNNRLYISNYKEYNNERLIAGGLNNITATVKFNDEGYDISKDEIYTVISRGDKIRSYKWQDNPNGFVYFDGSNIVVEKIFRDPDRPDDDYPVLDIIYLNKNDTLKVEYLDFNSITKLISIKASNIIISPFEPENDPIGVIYFYINGKLTNDCKTIVDITYEDGSSIDRDNPEYYNWFPFDSYSFELETITKANDQDSSIDLLNKISIYPNQPYNFFIHFIDKYGNVTQGFNLSYFNVIISAQLADTNNKLDSFTNKLGNLIIVPYVKESINKLSCSIKIDKIPNEYSGYFISYEQLEKSIIYSGITNNNKAGELRLYSDEFNYADKINLNFDKVLIYKSSIFYPNWDAENKLNINVEFTKNINSAYVEEVIKDKEIFVADSYDNIGGSTYIKLKIDSKTIYPLSICRLVKTIDDNFYIKENKTLIPCSNITYNTINPVYINTKTGFISTHHVSIFNEGDFFNNAIKVFQHINKVDAVGEALHNYKWIDYIEVPMESLQYNNKPEVVFFPDAGLNETDEKKKSFVVGNIVEAKNSIDLYQQKQVSVYELYPKSLTWYNNKIYNTDTFTKTIRRSNIIQDESRAVNWRNFELEQYKNITENKGDVMKLVSIGYFFIAHTQHSMFLFNATDTIKATQKDIQLASIDIWDINYKEVLTSDLGYAGIQSERHGITGEFGYIFFDKDSKRIYRYDNNKLDFIDGDINKFIYKISTDKSFNVDINIVDDKERNRIMFNIINLNRPSEQIILSYNYKTNTFVSKHTNKFIFGFATKNNSYYINSQNKILTYDYSNYAKSTCSIIINNEYPIMKYIEYIQYKVKEVTPGLYNDYLPVEGITRYYPGDRLRIYSEECDTGIIDISIAKPEDNVNKVTNYSKPYWELGNWNFNMIRDKFVAYQNGDANATNSSRIYGNWFVTQFEFDTIKQIEIETIEPKLSTV